MDCENNALQQDGRMTGQTDGTDFVGPCRHYWGSNKWVLVGF